MPENTRDCRYLYVLSVVGISGVICSNSLKIYPKRYSEVVLLPELAKDKAKKMERFTALLPAERAGRREERAPASRSGAVLAVELSGGNKKKSL